MAPPVFKTGLAGITFAGRFDSFPPPPSSAISRLPAVDRTLGPDLTRDMAGIVSYGSYVPYRRLKRAAIAQVMGVAAGKGERAVASFDEDSVSMAVEALRDALVERDELVGSDITDVIQGALSGGVDTNPLAAIARIS